MPDIVQALGGGQDERCFNILDDELQSFRGDILGYGTEACPSLESRHPSHVELWALWYHHWNDRPFV
jgi:hypothetical protein